MSHRRRESTASRLSVFAVAFLLSNFQFCFLLFNHGEEYEVLLTVADGDGLARSGLSLSSAKTTDASLPSHGSDPFSVSNRRSTPSLHAFPPSTRSLHRSSPPRNLRRFHTLAGCRSVVQSAPCFPTVCPLSLTPVPSYHVLGKVHVISPAFPFSVGVTEDHLSATFNRRLRVSLTDLGRTLMWKKKSVWAWPIMFASWSSFNKIISWAWSSTMKFIKVMGWQPTNLIGNDVNLHLHPTPPRHDHSHLTTLLLRIPSSWIAEDPQPRYQTSFCRGQKRSLFPSSFSKERTVPPSPLSVCLGKCYSEESPSVGSKGDAAQSSSMYLSSILTQSSTTTRAPTKLHQETIDSIWRMSDPLIRPRSVLSSKSTFSIVHLRQTCNKIGRGLQSLLRRSWIQELVDHSLMAFRAQHQSGSLVHDSFISDLEGLWRPSFSVIEKALVLPSSFMERIIQSFLAVSMSFMPVTQEAKNLSPTSYDLLIMTIVKSPEVFAGVFWTHHDLACGILPCSLYLRVPMDLSSKLKDSLSYLSIFLVSLGLFNLVVPLLVKLDVSNLLVVELYYPPFGNE